MAEATSPLVNRFVKELKWVYSATRKQWTATHAKCTAVIWKMVNEGYRFGWYLDGEKQDYAVYEWQYRLLSSAKKAAWLRFFG